MNLRLLALLWLALCTFSATAQQYLEMIEAGTYPIEAIQQAAEAHFDTVGRGRGSGYKQYKRWEYVAEMELDNSGVKIPNFELAKRARDYRRAEQQQQAESGNFGGDWKQLGPTYKNATSSWNPGVGRVTSIGIEANNNMHLIVGSPTGGIWKSLDGGNNWLPLTDDFSTVDVFSLEISPYDNKHYLWGSTSGRVYQSFDAGISWMPTSNLSGNGRVSRIHFHPTDPTIVYAVSESNGLFQSDDGGSTWAAVAGVSGVPGYDVEFNPGDPNTIYFSGIRVYRSTDGGTSFAQVDSFGTANNNYKMMGVSLANPNFVYVLESSGGKFGGFYKSTDSGASFTKLIDGSEINFFGYSATGDDDKGQAPRDMDVAVNPFDADEVHIAGTHTWKSTNGGVSFDLTSYWVPGTATSLGVGYNHADIDILKFVGDTLYVGSDGGIYISTDGAASFVDYSPGLGIKEFYKIGVSKSNPNVVSGGAQDNGTSVMRGADRDWVDWLGADGMETFVDWNNPNNLYGTSQYGSMYRSTNQGNSRSSISKPPDVDKGSWVTPFEQDPMVSTTIYVAFADVWKSTNSGGDWVKISEFDNGNMRQMKLAPSDNQRIYVSRGSSLFTTDDGGGIWTTTAKAWGNSTISYIAVHPLDPQRLLIVTSSGVYHSSDAGAAWTNISAGLPSGSKYCAVWEDTGKNGIYVGGFGFVSYTNDELAGQWVGFLDGLPTARIYELEISYVSNTIFAGTYGRGLWESTLYQALAPVADFIADKRQGCQTMTVAFTDKSENVPTAWEWTFEGGTPSSSTLQNPTVTYSGSGTYKVQLITSNDVGLDSMEVLDYITLVGPAAPTVADVTRCDEGDVSFEAMGLPGDAFNWYADATDATPLFTGDVFTTNIAQTSTFYATAGTNYLLSQRVGISSNNIGSGGNHVGDFFLIMDVEKPIRLKAVTVYATGSGNRSFQLRDSNENVLLEKIIFLNEGETRVTLDMDILPGANLQIGCPSPANLYRNDEGVTYPYSLNGLMEIKSSTAGPDYYYYLYDIEIESSDLCESDRIAVTATVNNTPAAPVIAASGPTVLCPGESVELTTGVLCTDCTVQWSNGATTPSISASTEGSYTATFSNSCGVSVASNTIQVILGLAPEATSVSASGPTVLCPGESVQLMADTVCPGCTVQWSNGETGPSISVATAGDYSATLSNNCGDSPMSNIIPVSFGSAPDAAVITASGPTTFCSGESVELTVDSICPGCTVQWSNGETGPSIIVATAGDYTATLINQCGDSPSADPIQITVGTIPDTAVITASGPTALCSGESVVLTVGNVCPSCTVQWSNGETGPSITATTEGNFTATLHNSCGDSPASDPISVNTESLPPAAIISAAGPTALCPGESVALTVENICAGCTVEWSNGEPGPSITASLEGAYTATISNTCGESPTSNEISVTSIPVFVPTVQVEELCHLTAPMGSDYQWFVNGVAIPGATGQIWSAQVAGQYMVSMIGPDGCQGSSEPVFVEACVSSTQEAEGFLLFQLFPNPAHDRIFLDIEMVQGSNLKLDLFAADGRFVRQIFEGEISAGRQTLDIPLPGVPAGMYRYRLATETGTVYGNLVVQQR